MAEFQEIFNGALFKNQYKDNDAKPDYTGRATDSDTGEELQAAAWIREARGTGKKYLYFNITRKLEDGSTQPVAQGDIDDDIPF